MTKNMKCEHAKCRVLFDKYRMILSNAALLKNCLTAVKCMATCNSFSLPQTKTMVTTENDSRFKNQADP